MGNLLSLEKEDSIEIATTTNSKGFNRFICEEIIKYENNYNYNSNRYKLLDPISGDRYILDTSKNYYGDINLLLLTLVEEMEFDINFLSLLGTSPLAYHHKDLKHIDYILYKYNKNPISSYETIKYIVNKDELPKNYKKYEYFQDGDENWYFLTKRYEPNLLKFEDNYRYMWEYKQDDHERLIIETITYSSLFEYIEKKPSFMIYRGKKLYRKDIKSVNQVEIKYNI